MSDLLTLADVCARFGLSDRRARAIIKAGRVPVLKPGKQFLFDDVALTAFLEATRCRSSLPDVPAQAHGGSRARSTASAFAKVLELTGESSPRKASSSLNSNSGHDGPKSSRKRSMGSDSAGVHLNHAGDGREHEPWVSRSPLGGWVYWLTEAEYRENERGGYSDGRPANECERSLIEKLRGWEDGDMQRTGIAILMSVGGGHA